MFTYYFRTSFNVADLNDVVALSFTCLVDDGAVFYLNGVEIQRVGMGAGTVNYATPASRSVGDATAVDNFSISGDLLTNLVAGANVLAVEVHQQAATSSDIVFGATVSASSTAKVTRGPYLQNGSATNVTIRWRSDVATSSAVYFGLNQSNLDRAVVLPGVIFDHEVRLSELLPDTQYFYAFGSSSTNLLGGDMNHYFVTAPIPGTPKPTRIWVLGDSGTASSEQVSVRDAYENFAGARHTDLWLMLGDNAYDTGTDAEYQQALFDIYTNTLRSSVLWSSLGNHETAQATAFVDTYPFFDIFTFPRNGEAGGVASGTEHYYSFDYGNIHFICLDSMTSGRSVNSAMYLWLTNDLANITADWTVAFWHHPPYTKGSHDSDNEVELIQMRQVFLPLLEQAGVDLVLSGHSHCYERSYLLDQHYGLSGTLTSAMKIDGGSGRENGSGPYRKNLFDPRAHQGAVYAVVGCSGQATGGDLNHPAMFVSLNQLGSLVLDINSNRLDATFLRGNGETNDAFTILKMPDTTSLRLVSPVLDSSGHGTITWASVGGVRYRVSYRDGNPDGVFTEIVRASELEVDSAAPGQASTRSFTDDFTLTGGPPATGARYYRVRVVP